MLFRARGAENRTSFDGGNTKPIHKKAAHRGRTAASVREPCHVVKSNLRARGHIRRIHLQLGRQSRRRNPSYRSLLVGGGLSRGKSWMISGARKRRLMKYWAGVLQIGLRHTAMRDGSTKWPEALKSDAANRR